MKAAAQLGLRGGITLRSFGLELLATVDWMLVKGKVTAQVPALRAGLLQWEGGAAAAMRKDKMFDDRALAIALKRLVPSEAVAT